MKHITQFFLVLCCTLVLNTAQAQQAQRMYFVGNSLTDNIKYDGLTGIVQSRGNSITIGSQRIPGAPLSWLWDNITSGFTHEPYGFPQNAFAVYSWDILSLQPFDRPIEDPSGQGDRSTVAKYYNLIKTKSPDTKVFIFGHWPRTPNNIPYTEATKEQYNSIWTDASNIEARKFYQDLTTAVRSDYPATADKIVMVPVGEVFYSLNNNPAFLAALGINSIWGLYYDGIHQGLIGEYICASTFYAMAYHDDPAGLGVPGIFGTIPPAALTHIQQTIKDVIVAKSDYTGISYFGPAPVQSVALNASALELNVTKTATLTPIFTPSNAANKSVSWSSSNDAVASVANGVVTAKTVGTANITVTTADGSFQSVCEVNVTNTGTAVTSIALNKATTSIVKLATETLIATISPADATNKNVIWTSSDSSIATVSATGLVTAVKKGSATITVTSVNGLFTASTAVTITTINTPPVAVLKYSPGNNGYTPYKVTFDARSSYDNDPGDFVLGFDWVIKLKGSASVIKTEVSNGFDYTFTTPGVYEVTLQAVDNDALARSLNTETVTITVAENPAVPVDETAICYEGFDYFKMAITDLNGGRGWNGGWQVQDPLANDANGFAVDTASPMTVTNLRQAGNYMKLGRGYEQCGRALDVSSNGAFKDYLNGSMVGKPGTTLWFSAIIRPQNNNKTCAVSFVDTGIAWYGQNAGKKVEFGGLGGSFWGFAFGFEGTQEQHLSTLPIVNNQPVFLVAKIEFGATNTVSLYLNPSPGNTPTGTPVVASTTMNLDFRVLGTTYGWDADKMGLDEIRFGTTYSDVAPVSTPDADAPTTPTGLVAGTISNVSVVLNWNASVNLIDTTTYDIYNGNSFVGSTTNTTYTVNGLTASTLYSFTIVARDGFGTAPATSALSVTTAAPDITAPTVPSNLTAVTITDNSVVMNWTASSDAVGVTGYDVYNGATLLGTTASTTFTASGLTASTGYSFTVKAKDAAGNVSAASPALNVSTTVAVASSTYRYLKLAVTTQVSSLLPSFYEIEWMVGATSYPSAAVTDGALIITDNPGIYSYANKYFAFDKNIGGNQWAPLDGAPIETPPYFITIDLGAGNEIYPTAIGLTIPYKGRGLAAFTCEGSNDNSNWATLLTVTGLVESDWITDATKSFNISAPTLSELKPISEQGFALYPNPVQNQLYLNFGNHVENAQVSILDLQGRTLMTQLLTSTTSATLDVSGLTNGVYFVKVLVDGKVMNSKFIKQ